MQKLINVQLKMYGDYFLDQIDAMKLNGDHESRTKGSAMPANSAQLLVRRAALAAAGLIFLTAAHAHASGRLPPVPIPPRAFPDFSACRAFLQESYRQDISRAEPTPVAIEGGSTRQTLIESDGPIELDPSHARYEVTEGWQVRHPVPEKGYTEISYSHRTTTRTCAGGALTGTYEQGYNSPSYENLR